MAKTAEDWYSGVLRRLEQGSREYFGVSGVRCVPLHNTDREASLLLRARVDGGSEPVEIFVKMLKPKGHGQDHRRVARERVENDFATMLQVHRRLLPLRDLAVVRPVACFPDDLVIVTERAPGETLGAVLERCASWWPDEDAMTGLERTLARVGAWIRTFQAEAASGERFSLDGMRHYVDVRLRRLTGLPRAAFSEDWRTRVLDYFESRRGEIAPEDLDEVRVHADIAPGNILVDGERITVLDFAMATVGGRYHDVARLHSQLEFLTAKPKFRRPVVDRLQAALLGGFEPGLSPNHPLFELFVLQHRLCHLANLSGNPASGLSRVYNWYQRKRHLDWLQATAGPAGARLRPGVEG